MDFKKVAVLTSRESWFVPYAKRLVRKLNSTGYTSVLFFDHTRIGDKYEVIFILSYFKIIKDNYLKRHKYNLVVHESDLPKGRGWAPLFWQILEGKNRIPIVLFEAAEGIDSGKIFIKDYIIFKGDELGDEIREEQAHKTFDLCLKFLKFHNALKPKKQKGKPTYYRKRIPIDSKLDINRTIKEQFGLLRIVDNENYPPFFFYKGHKYILKIFKGY